MGKSCEMVSSDAVLQIHRNISHRIDSCTSKN